MGKDSPNFKTYKNGNLPTTANGASDIFSNRPIGTSYLEEKGFLGFGKSAITDTMSSKENAKMIACLMDTKVWEGFAGGLPNGVNGIAYSIGGPTLSMWAESWNIQHGTNSSDEIKAQVYYNRASSIGYNIKKASQPSAYDYEADLRTSTGYTRIEHSGNEYTGDLYFPHKAHLRECDGYWLVSPSADRIEFGVLVYYGGLLTTMSYNYDRAGARPVVCLPSSIQLTETAEGSNLYTISNKTTTE